MHPGEYIKMKIGFWEIVVVLIVALFVIGPDKLPSYMKQLGKGAASLRKATAEMSDELQEDVVKPLNEAAKPLMDAANTINDATDQVNKTIHDVQHPSQAVKRAAKQQEKKKNTWICPVCGAENDRNFCSSCGARKPEPVKETVEEAQSSVTAAVQETEKTAETSDIKETEEKTGA